VAGAAWWLERPGKAPAVTPTPATAPLWTIESTSVMSVRLEDTQAKTVVELARSTDGTWSLVQPSKEPADTGAVEMAIAQMSNLSLITDLGTKITLENFGMDKPRYMITLTTADATYTLEVGSPTVTGSGYYVRRQGDPRVVVVGTYALESVLGWAQSLPLPATPTPPATATLAEPTATLEAIGTPPEGTSSPATATATATAVPTP
ncbi:MAG: DUF4340 domain-containing protein, partial [Chloroflexi bacterium]|nr:DUF4340 domain-containing protein [Chloroflexota bacterium]